MTVSDRWYRSEKQPDGSKKKVRSADYGCEKRWQVRWRDENGKQRKKNFAKKSSAESFAAKIKTQLSEGTYIDPAAGKVTLKSYAEQWRAALTCDPLTLVQITSRLKVHVYPEIGDTAMGVLAKRPSLIQQWIKRLEAKLSASTIIGVVGWVSTIFEAAIEDGIVSRNPCKARSVRAPKVPEKKVVPWTLAQVRAAGAALPSRFEAMVDLGAGCGHRQGELFGVGLEDVDFLGRVVHIRRQVRVVAGALVFSPPKGGKTRTVPLPDSVALRLSAHIAAHPPVKVALPWRTPGGELVEIALLFTTEDGKALKRPDFNRLWRPARITTGAQDSRDNGMHVLRHTAASAWLFNGVDIGTVADFLGHNDPGFTLRVYRHFMPEAEDRARKAMDAFFQGTAQSPSALNVPSESAR